MSMREIIQKKSHPSFFSAKSLVVLFSFLAFFLNGSVLHAQNKKNVEEKKAIVKKEKKKKVGKGQDLPESKIVQVEKETADDAFRYMYVTHKFDSAASKGKVFPGTDLIKLETSLLDKIIKGTLPETKGMPLNKIKYVVVRYGIGDPAYIAKLIEAKKAGIDVNVVTDLNRSLDFEFTDDLSKPRIDFKNGAFKSNQTGEGIKELLDSGVFKYNENIFSQPVFDTDDGKKIIDILHEKDTFVIKIDGTKETPLIELTSTANLTSKAPRYNRTLGIEDEAMLNHDYEHVKNVIAGLKEGKEISEIKNVGPLRLEFKDGTFVESAATDGRFNVNDRIINLMKDAIEKPKKIQIKKIVLSEFLVTNGSFVETLKQLMEVQKDFVVEGVMGDLFSTTVGWGKTPALVGYNIYPPMGKITIGYSNDLRQERINLYGYQSAIPEVGEPILDGAPDFRDEWHDKTILIEAVEDGKPVTYVATGSMNLSTHIDNLEKQYWMKLDTNKALAKSFNDSILGTIKYYPKQMVPYELAVFRKNLGYFFQRSNLEIDIDEVKKLVDAVHARDYSSVTKIVQSIESKPTAMLEKISSEELASRTQKLEDFIAWMEKLPNGANKIERLSLRRLSEILLIASGKISNSGHIKFALNGILWSPDIPKAELERLTEESLKALNIDASLRSTAAEKALASKFDKGKRLSMEVFDFDNTMVRMPTQIILFEKGTGNPLAVSTEEFDRLSKTIGKTGKFKNYEVLNNEKTGQISFKNFFSDGKVNQALADFKEVEKLGASAWQGSAWNDFALSMSTAEEAELGSVLTARGHSTKDMNELFEYMKSQGYIKNTPLQKNLFLSSNFEINVDKLKVPDFKAQVINQKLNELDEAAAIYKRRLRPTFRFFDDSPENTQKVIDSISKIQRENALKWDNLDIYVEKVAINKPPVTYFLANDGEVIKMKPGEYVKAFGTNPFKNGYKIEAGSFQLKAPVLDTYYESQLGKTCPIMRPLQELLR